jgi:GGDEF domain-containing protein
MAIGEAYVEDRGIRSKLRQVFRKPTPIEKPSASGVQNEEALRRMILLLMQAVEKYAIPGDEIDYQQFRESMRSMSKRFDRPIGPDDVLILAGQFSASLKDYYEHTSRFLSTHNAEYQKMVSMFTETVSSFSASGQRSVTNLKDLEQQIERATVIEDIRTLRLRLEQCLGTIRDEIDRQETLSVELLAPISQSGESSLTKTEHDFGPYSKLKSDPVTGFPTLNEAEASLSEALQSDQAAFAVPIVAKGANAIYSHLGSKVGDDFMYKFSEQLQFLSRNGDRIYRWHGYGFVALLRRSTTITEVKRELSSLSRVQFDDPIEVGERLTWLPVSALWDVIAVTPPLSSLLRSINEFIAP